MIPLLAVIGVKGRWNFRLWLPLFLVWLLLLPFAPLLLPFLLIAALFIRADAWRGIGAVFSVLCATRGTQVEVATRGHSLLLHIF
ncbi:MAG TPA: hypothetical protein VHX61_12270 [Rhizomicrobium sp.]|jgi:hypothetical protein|nr:hypothetical protein [Rhizomicrobium sp.]